MPRRALFRFLQFGEVLEWKKSGCVNAPEGFVSISTYSVSDNCITIEEC